MRVTARNHGGYLAWSLGIACLAGCHDLDHAPPRPGPLAPGSGPTKPVSRAQEADMQISLGQAAERRGAFDEAMFAYQEALKRDKHRADAYQRLAVLHDRQGHFRESAELYKQALGAAPGNPDIYCDMGYSLFLQRRWAESERNLRQAIAVSPNHARAHNNLGMVLAFDHRDEEALAEYHKAGNNDADASGNLAVAMTLSGRVDEARDQYKRILALDSSSKIARARLQELDTLVARVAARPHGPLRDEKLLTASAPASSATPAPSPPQPPSGER